MNFENIIWRCFGKMLEYKRCLSKSQLDVCRVNFWIWRDFGVTAWTKSSQWEKSRGRGEAPCNKVHRAGRIKRSSITRWSLQVPIIRPCQLGCGILFRALNVLSTAKNFHKTAICHLREGQSPFPRRRRGGEKKSIWLKSHRQLYIR